MIFKCNLPYPLISTSNKNFRKFAETGVKKKSFSDRIFSWLVRCIPSLCTQMSRLVRKPTICIGENKDADQLRAQISFAVTAKLISAFVFATRIVQFLLYFNPKFQASSSFLCLYRSVCVGPVRKPHCWFSHEVAQIYTEFYSQRNFIFDLPSLLRKHVRFY